jgi:cellulose synthase/poly-beta-1,6-N-acetylglucosamine synthase-like glycosyltransferase
VETVALDLSVPFTAARARNQGFQRLVEVKPDIEYVQFLDGDCEMQPGWLARAAQEMASRPDAAVVCGRRRERFPQASVYNLLCDIEWDTPVGTAHSCGGDALLRVAAFREVGGYDPGVIAGEEPELCLRLRRRSWLVLRIDAEMTLHDADMHRFGQWWRRSLRSGFAYALGANLHGRSPDRHWVRERRSALLWGFAVPAAAVGAVLPSGGLSLLLGLLYPLQVLRIYWRMRRRGIARRAAAAYALSCVVAKFPQFLGVCKFMAHRLHGRPARIIEYK